MVVCHGAGDDGRARPSYFDSESESVESIIKNLEDDEELLKAAEALASDGPIDLATAEALADSAPVRKLLNMVLLLAIKDHASDIHFEPFEDEFRIRIKADGVLYEMVPPPRHLAFAITTRIKVMSNSTSPSDDCPRTAASSCRWAATRSTCESACCRRCSARAS